MVFAAASLAPSSVPASESHRRNRRAGVAATLVSAPFLPALAESFRLTHENGLQSYAPVVPLVAAYIGWKAHAPAPDGGRRGNHGGRDAPDNPPESRSPVAAGSRRTCDALVVLAAILTTAAALAFARLAEDPALAAALRILAWIALLAAALASTLGRAGVTRWRLPLLLLLFIAPLPQAVVSACETYLQHGSAACARLLLEIHGTPVHLDHLTLHLRGMTLWVAPECSGLRSSLVLLLLTVITAGTLLRTTAARVALIMAVALIAVARNGLRIFVIGTMCAQQGPAALDSFLHRQGGPVFFALSLAPWAVLVLALHRREAAARRSASVFP